MEKNEEIINELIEKIKIRRDKLDEIVAHTSRQEPPSEKAVQDFYRSKAWTNMRKQIIQRDIGISQYLLYTQHVVKPGNVVHHIFHLRQWWSLRLEPLNLEIIDAASHNIEHKGRSQTERSYKLEDEQTSIDDFKLKFDITTDNGTPEL